MIKLIDGGHFSKKGYYYKLYLVVPEFSSSSCKSITGSDQKTKKVEFNSGFWLTSDNVYSNILFRLLGFGWGLEIHSRS